ncbi:MAG TPA: hypothetical protein VGV15_00310 [Terriglobales bacterium]|nr:hypothetical protein [Terriglobales bacterium]
MQKLIRTSLPTPIRQVSVGTSLSSLASRPVVAALAILLLARVACHPAAAQVSSQTLPTHASVKHQLSPEVLALHARAKRPVAAASTSLELAAPTAVASTTFNSEQGPGPGPIGPGPGCNLFPAPPSVGATVPLSYFGPSPSEVNQSLVGPVQLLKSGTVDVAHGTITLPLYKGRLAGTSKNIWYILTDVSDSNVAAELGLNFSTKLEFSSLAARTGNLDAEGNIVFNAGTVNFASQREIIPGPPGHEFPPKFARPGAIGDANYGPLVRIVNAGDVIYNASMVAFAVDAAEINFPNGNVDYSKVHDEVVAIDPVNMTVTINLINGFSFGRPVWYMSMDTSSSLGAAIEHNTFAPLARKLVLGHDDSFASPVERIFIATNGAEEAGCNNPQRQGLSADLADSFRPNNVLGGIPTIALDYSPNWDAQLFEWTQSAVDQGFRGQVREEFQILNFVRDGLLTGPGGAAFGSAGFSINCPIVQRLD